MNSRVALLFAAPLLFAASQAVAQQEEEAFVGVGYRF